VHTRKIGTDQSATANRVACEASCIKNLLTRLLRPDFLGVTSEGQDSQNPHDKGAFILERNAYHHSPALRFRWKRELKLHAVHYTPALETRNTYCPLSFLLHESGWLFHFAILASSASLAGDFVSRTKGIRIYCQGVRHAATASHENAIGYTRLTKVAG